MGENVTLLVADRERGASVFYRDIARSEVERTLDKHVAGTVSMLTVCGLAADDPRSFSRLQNMGPDVSIAYTIMDNGTDTDILRGRGIERTGRISSDSLRQRLLFSPQ